MKYNTEVKNDGALPIPYMRIVGSVTHVGALYKDRPLYINLMFVTFSETGQVTLRGTEESLVIQQGSGLIILPLFETKVSKQPDAAGQQQTTS